VAAPKKKAESKPKKAKEKPVDNEPVDDASTHSKDTTLTEELGLDSKTGVESESDQPAGDDTVEHTDAQEAHGEDDPANPFDYNDKAEEKTGSVLTEDKVEALKEQNQGGTGNIGQTVEQVKDIEEREDGRQLARDNYALGSGPRLFRCPVCHVLTPVAKDGEIPDHYPNPIDSTELCEGSGDTFDPAKENR
jgi:hypothetical protein